MASSEISSDFGDSFRKNDLNSGSDWSSRQSSIPAEDRLLQLVTEETPNWSFSGDWVTVL
ncbi:mitogen-activated protein kinase kinase kinase 3 [Prunus yedoensis var. nudiflora]|nr:mitogen-activated protein kinase kinase kinase 3 [Prunus yedoensis var. nudiflora]